MMPGRVLILIVTSVLAAGCFSTATTVKVRPDGSGTIELTTLLGKAPLAAFDELFAGHGIEPQKPRTVHDWFPERDVQEAAARLGTDVRYVSSRTIDTDDRLGRVTIYEFADIRRVTLEPLPILPGDSYGADARVDGERRFTFDLVNEPENRRVLIARLPEARIEYADVSVHAERFERPDPQEEALMRRLLAGLRLTVAVEPESPISGTNTLHRDGQRVTLVSIDAERLIFDDEVSKRLLLRPTSFDELRYRLHDRPGVIVSLDREVRIELAPR